MQPCTDPSRSRRTAPFGVLLLLVLFAACNEPSTSVAGGAPDGGGVADTGPGSAVDGSSGDTAGAAGKDVARSVEDGAPRSGDGSSGGTPDGAADAAAPHDAQDAGADPIGAPCSGPSDCASGLCVEAQGGLECTRPCGDGCPAGWTCASAPDGKGDLCVSLYGSLCNPCRSNAECAKAAAGARCVSFGDDGAFCGAPCGGGCPEGTVCSQGTDVDGAQTEQCTPKDHAACECRESARAGGLSTDCRVTAAVGTCTGTRACGQSGLSACSAAQPAAEVCGGGDEDCDGETDEQDAVGCVPFYEDGDGDGVGSDAARCLCAGTGDYTATQSGDCDDADPAVVPGAPCGATTCSGDQLTPAPICGPDGACVAGAAAPCPGKLACATGSECLESCSGAADCQAGAWCGGGVCLATQDPGAPCASSAQCETGHCANGFCCAAGDCCVSAGDCDDANVCTTDACSDNQCTHSPNAAPCTQPMCAGSSWVGVAVCSGGVCGAAPVLDCAGAEPCRKYGCDPAAGCVVEDAAAGLVCGEPACDGESLTPPPTCDGAGVCVSAVAPEPCPKAGADVAPCPNGFACLTQTGCRTTCQSDAHCAPDYYCRGGKCTAAHDDGQACTADGQCASGHCTNGTCCAGGACCSAASQCDDGDPCTTDACVDFQCQSVGDVATCASGACVGLTWAAPRQCGGGACLAPTTEDCGGASPCELYGCSPTQGCTVGDAPAGPPCGTGQCAGFILTSASVCDGAGVCGSGASSGPCPGGYVCADVESCATQCADDSGCRDGLFCQATVCLPKRTSGESCTASGQCATGHCASGYCCLQGNCCGGNDAHCNDANPCTTDTCGATFQCSNVANTAPCAAATCQGSQLTAAKTCSDGLCAGGGAVTDCQGDNACKVYGCEPGGCTESNAPVGQLCGLPVSSGYTLSETKTCDGLGGCTAGGGAKPCAGGFACLDASACRAQCSFDSHCAPGYRCSGQKCVSKSQDGVACGENGECLSGHCGGGLCCSGAECCAAEADCDGDDPCTDDTCFAWACAHTPNEAPCGAPACDGNTLLGVPVCSGGACQAAPVQAECSGVDPCLVYGCAPTGCTVKSAATGAPCGAGFCDGSTLTSGLVFDAAGACVSGDGTGPCPGGFTCASGTACRTACADNSQCRSDFYCKASVCLPRSDDGGNCTADAQCLSGHCANGYCCASGKCCGGNDAQCAKGSCGASGFTPSEVCGASYQCEAQPTEPCAGDNPCMDYGCNPVGGCTATAAPGRACAAAVCQDDALSPAGTCDDAGACAVPVTAPCPGSLKCKDGASCLSTCGSSADCRAGTFCLAGACKPLRANGAGCGASDQCQSGHCDSGLCCAGGTCCATPDVCDDGNVCTGNACVDNQCVSTVLDGKVCKAAACDGLGNHAAPKTCFEGACSLGGESSSCADADACTADSCNALLGCLHTPKDCDDGVLCSEDSCDAAGECVHTPVSDCCGTNADCATGDPCMQGACDVGSGECSATPLDGPACDDGNECTDGDACVAGLCLGAAVADGAACDDGGTETVTCGDKVCHSHCESPSSCATDCKLVPTKTLKSGEHIESVNTTGVSQVSKYSCDTATYPGKEKVYKYVPPADGALSVTLSSSLGTLGVLVIEDTGSGCNPNDCQGVKMGNAKSAYLVSANTTYCIVVDYPGSTSGMSPFDIVATFRSLAGVCTAVLYEDWNGGFSGPWTTSGAAGPMATPRRSRRTGRWKIR